MDIKHPAPRASVIGGLRAPLLAAVVVGSLVTKQPAATLKPQPAKHIEGKVE